MKKLYVIDASGYLYRSYFAIRNITNDKGESTNALYGYIRSILKLIKDFNTEHIVSVFDGPQSTKSRVEIYEDYKAHREKTPSDLRYQIDWAKDFCDLMGIPKLVFPGIEADDTMGSIAKWAGENDVDVFLCTSDKDMAQLVTEHVKLLNTHKDNKILGPKEVEKTYGVPPNKIIDWLAMTGDASDNVPGLPGFGPKTAVELLQAMGSLEKILQNPDQVPGKKKQETIRNEKDKALLSKQLVTIDLHVDIPKDETFYFLKDPNIPKLKDFYTYMNFNSLLKELDQQKKNTEQEDVTYNLVDDEKSLAALISILEKQNEICFDTETTDIHPMQAELIGIGFGIEPTKAWYVPVNGKLGLEKVLKSLKPLFENSSIGFYGHNIKYDWHILKNYDITIKNICFDSLIASYILNANLRQHSLDALSLNYFGKVKTPITDLIGKGQNQISMRDVPIETVSHYCCEDVDYTSRLKLELQNELKKRDLEKLYYELELPLISVLAQMERHGMYVDTDKLVSFSKEIRITLNTLTESIYDLAGEEFNINSPKQIAHILFDKLGIKSVKKTATGNSTNAAVLETLKTDYPIAEKILEYRTLEKLRSGYADTLPEMVSSKSHRIHPNFLQSATSTGRIACQDPNLQNIPVRTELGKKIREAFRPEKKDWSYLAADYSQMELRLLAHFSDDPTLVKAFKEGQDIHTHTAATVYGIPLDQVTKEMRSFAKAVNFGMIYGQQAFGLSKQLGIPVKEAAEFITTYFQRYDKVQIFLESCKEQTRNTQKSITIMGRERLIPEINSKNGMIRTAAERLAVNTPLQGSNADLIKLAMLQIDEKLKTEQIKSYMVLQIHDELIFEVPDDEIESIKPLVKETMENVFKLNVPLVVDIKLGKNWKEC